MSTPDPDLADLLTDTAAVYDDAGVSGAYDHLLKAALPCRFSTVSTGPARTGRERAELASTAELYWTEDYVMPNGAQVELNGDGVRWDVRPGTVRRPTMPDDSASYGVCDLVRVTQLP